MTPIPEDCPVVQQAQPAVKHSDWKTLAIWALLTLLGSFSFYMNSQFTSFNTQISAMAARSSNIEVSINNLLLTNEKRITALESREDLILKIAQERCK